MPAQPTDLPHAPVDSVTAMTDAKSEKSPFLPPRWFVSAAWKVHRAIFNLSGGKLGLAVPKPNGDYGTMRVTTTGRRSGEERPVILAYYEDGPNLVTIAMNGWGEAEPAWWLNLQANPEARVELKDETKPRPVRARKAEGEERDRLWNWIKTQGGYGGTKLDSYAALRPTETAIVVLEPQTGTAA